MVPATLRNTILLLAGCVVCAGTSEVSAAGRPRLKSPLEWLRKRSAEQRYNVFSKEHDRARAFHFRSDPQRTRPAEPGPNPASLLPQQGSERGALKSQDSQLPLNGAVPGVSGRPDTIRRVGAQSFIDAGYQNTTSDPDKLKRVTTILPYADYAPIEISGQPVAENLREPEEIDLSSDEASVRSMEATVFQWQPSNLWHYPLYFEDPGLERSGHSFEHWLQPFCSVGRFGLQLVGMPYQMTLDPVCKKRYALGWYRPGECAPKQVGQIPWNTKAVINQAAVTTGAFFALP